MAEKQPDWAGAHHRQTMQTMGPRAEAARELLAGATRLRLEFTSPANISKAARVRQAWPELYDAINDICQAMKGYQ